MLLYRVSAVLCLVITSASPTWAQGGTAPRAAAVGLDQAMDLGLEAVLIVLCAAFALMLSASVARE